jgi:hypothetical protein
VDPLSEGAELGYHGKRQSATSHGALTMIHMTPDQEQALRNGDAVRVRDTESGEDVVVCPLSLFEEMQRKVQESMEDDMEQQAWVELSTKCLIERFQEDQDVQPG